ncbi:MAG: DNA-3-methyladenine glycosylase I [Acidobacteriota bacterium]|nr:DNA-3-methyladenine glycosylase I [Acidobacteriota bacterium]
MLSFDQIYRAASRYKGGEDALESLLPQPKTAAELRAVSDDRYLSGMTRHIFSAGFVWRVIEAKWPGFERAFTQFDPEKAARLSDADLEALAQNPDIVRNPQKIRTVRANAALILEVRSQHGNFGKFIADWPDDDITGLWQWLKKHGSRLGGNSGPFFLRRMGKDTFLLTRDVITALQRQGILEKNGNSKREQSAVQNAFLQWQRESGRPLCQISRILSCTVVTSEFPDPDKL